MNDLDYINCPYPGEMLPLERQYLYNTIIVTQPEVILEVGCGEGASTYYISEAVRRNKKGLLYTCDPDRQPTLDFLRKYDDECNHFRMKSSVLIDYMISINKIPDFIFFDGPEDLQVALDDFLKLEPHLKAGTTFCMHDWCTEKRAYDGAISTKALLLKDYINKSPNWKLTMELSGTKEPAESVGFAFYILTKLFLDRIII